LQRQKSKQKGLLLRRAFSGSLFPLLLLLSDYPTKALSIHLIYGAVTFGPGAALQRGGFQSMCHGLDPFSDSVTFKPMKETTAMQVFPYSEFC
jgi:hypothetical protein